MARLGICFWTAQLSALKLTLAYTLYVGTNYQKGRKFTGTIDEFQIYDRVALHTENFMPPTDEYYADLKNALEDSATFVYIVDVETKYRTSLKNDTDNAYIALTGGNYATLPEGILPDANNNSRSLCVNDGKLCFWAEPEVGDPYNLTTEAVIIGVGYSLTTATRLDMNLHEARFWSKSLTAEEIFSDVAGNGNDMTLYESRLLTTTTLELDYLSAGVTFCIAFGRQRHFLHLTNHLEHAP